ncbi:MAG: hypothetical protein Q9219_006598 [cf. Caloplaca sp. 3 TL-2023]
MSLRFKQNSLPSDVLPSNLSTPAAPSTNRSSRPERSRPKKAHAFHEVVLAPAASETTLCCSEIKSVDDRKISLDSSASSISGKGFTVDSTKTTKKKRKGVAAPTKSSQTSRRASSLSYSNIYTTTDRSGRARVGSGSGAPGGCLVM